MQTSVIYEETSKLLKYGARRIIHQGGQNSGKTVNIIASLAEEACRDKGGVTTVTSMSMPHLKGGALRDFELFVFPTFQRYIKHINKTDKTFVFKGGHILEFKVFDNEGKARGAKRKRLFVNEADRFDYMTFFQLDSRSEQSIIDYNPAISFWAHEKVIPEDGSHLLITDHRHNPFLTESKHREIESIRDPELFRVYARGLTGNIKGVIFPDWQMIDDDDFPDNHECVFGVDFGFTNDPTAVVKLVLVHDTLFVKEILYETGVSEHEIFLLLKANGWNSSTPVYCDHVPEAIRALRKIGCVNAFQARKGQGSIFAGIQQLKKLKVFYTSKSRNLHRERPLYIWLVDKDGNPTNVPIDKNNHTFDAIRYGYFSHFIR